MSVESVSCEIALNKLMLFYVVKKKSSRTRYQLYPGIVKVILYWAIPNYMGVVTTKIFWLVYVIIFPRHVTLFEKNSNTGAFLWILQSF